MSAGILPFRRRNEGVEVFLVHPGGPFWTNKDLAGWTVAKGEIGEGEAPIDAARREFAEETGLQITAALIDLGSLRQPSGKVVFVWAAECDLDPTRISSNRFTMEWPKKSGQQQEFPEVDKAGWFDLTEAARKLHKGQVGFLHRLESVLGLPPSSPAGQLDLVPFSADPEAHAGTDRSPLD